MRGKTLEERVYGPGYRPGAMGTETADLRKCGGGYIGCNDPVAGSMEMWVDDRPPALDWYTRILNKLPANSWTRVAFCMGHMEEAVERSLTAQEAPDAWAPWRENPFVLTRPPSLMEVPHG